MIITVASHKGGVGKSTTSVHLAHYLNTRFGSTLLIDGDSNRSIISWSKRSKGFDFMVCDERQAAKFSREYDHIVIDTAARVSNEDLEALALGCDILLIPSTPDALSLDALYILLDALDRVPPKQFSILLTIIPPFPQKDGIDAQKLLEDHKLPVLSSMIRRFVAFQKAALQGITVDQVSDQRSHDAALDYESAFDELLATHSDSTNEK